MKCKFCGEEMPDNGKFCPYCGVDNDLDEIPEQSSEPDTAKVDAKLKGWRLTAAISGCVAIMAVLALALFFFTGYLHLYGGWKTTTEVSCTVDGVRTRSCLFCDKEQTETVAALGHDYVNTVCTRCNGSGYTASDDEAVRKADDVVATFGNLQLTNAELQIYYQMEITSFVNQYYYYLSYFGFDYTKPLDEQNCSYLENGTWQQYFLDEAISTWYQQAVLAEAAQNNHYELDEETLKSINDAMENLETTATKQGYASADEFLQSSLGTTVTAESYRKYLNDYYLGYGYFQQVYEQIEDLPDSELDAYFEKNKDKLKEEGIEQDDEMAVNVRHILISLGKDEDGNLITGTEKDGAVTFDDEALAAAAKTEAERILALWKENPTEEYFSELANEYSHDQDGKVTDGGIYEGIQKTDNYVTQFLNWCFEDDRQVGDCEIVATKYGYHIMYFSAQEPVWKGETRDYYKSEQLQEIIKQIMNERELKVEYTQIALPYVSLT